MQDWGLSGNTKFNIRYQKSDSSRNIVVCAEAGCRFRVYAVLSGNKEYVFVATVLDEHNCVGAAPMFRSLASQQIWLQRILPTTIPLKDDDSSANHRCCSTASSSHCQLSGCPQSKENLGDELQQQGISSGYFPPTSTLSVQPIRKHSYTCKWRRGWRQLGG